MNNVSGDMDIDFNSMREAFRAIDTSNTGIITIEQVKKGFAHDSHITHINHELID